MKQVTNTSCPTVMTIGNFDGLHKGHQKLIRKVTALAEKKQYKSLVCTFDIHTKGSQLIDAQNDLFHSLSQMGVDYFSVLNFHNEIKGLTCEDFVKEFICNRFHAKYVLVGENFRFGVNQSGTTETLKKLGEKYNFSVIIVTMLSVGSTHLSSTYLRELLQAGKLKRANQYLYHPYCIYGTVQKGTAVGSSVLNYPTANIKIPDNAIALPYGVYVTKIQIDKKEYIGLTNIGFAPTFGKKAPVIETHILDYCGNLYRKRIKIFFLKYIRKERKFSSVDALKKQIEKDILSCRQFFE